MTEILFFCPFWNECSFEMKAGMSIEVPGCIWINIKFKKYIYNLPTKLIKTKALINQILNIEPPFWMKLLIFRLLGPIWRPTGLLMYQVVLKSVENLKRMYNLPITSIKRSYNTNYGYSAIIFTGNTNFSSIFCPKTTLVYPFGGSQKIKIDRNGC